MTETTYSLYCMEVCMRSDSGTISAKSPRRANLFEVGFEFRHIIIGKVHMDTCLDTLNVFYVRPLLLM